MQGAESLLQEQEDLKQTRTTLTKSRRRKRGRIERECLSSQMKKVTEEALGGRKIEEEHDRFDGKHNGGSRTLGRVGNKF